MLDPELLVRDFDFAREQLARRGFDLTHDTVDQYVEQQDGQRSLEELRARKNAVADTVGSLMRERRRDEAEEFINEGRRIGEEIKGAETSVRGLNVIFLDSALRIPNLPAADTPDGKGEVDNVVLSSWGSLPKFDFDPLDHVDIAERLGVLDQPKGVQLTQSRFSVLRREGSALQRGLISFMLDKAIEEGYEEVTVPYLVNSATMQGTGQLPKFEDDLFKTDDGLYLIPTAEVPVTNLYAGTTLLQNDLPIGHVAYTECFRREAGSAGRDTRGILRQHQFSKVELIQVTRPEDSWEVLDKMTNHAAGVLEDLELPHRRVALCAGDLGFAAAWTTDLEVWLPGQNQYREISSISNTLDFQSRRMGLRMRDPNQKKPVFPHTLNGSALAVGRTIVAILENYQQDDGSVRMPDALRPYLPFDSIAKK